MDIASVIIFFWLRPCALKLRRIHQFLHRTGRHFPTAWMRTRPPNKWKWLSSQSFRLPKLVNQAECWFKLRYYHETRLQRTCTNLHFVLPLTYCSTLCMRLEFRFFSIFCLFIYLIFFYLFLLVPYLTGSLDFVFVKDLISFDFLGLLGANFP